MKDKNRLALEQFLIDNSELERLETLLDEFNIFEVLGVVNVELRHSEFLAYLMNPKQNHALDDIFVKRFLQKTIAGVDPSDLPFTAIDLDIWNLNDLEIRREWRNIDILLVSEANHMVILIENKIRSGEHSKQLQRYHRTVEQQFSGWKILGLFLTPEGDEPTDERFLPVSYETVCSLIESLAESRKSTLGPDIYTLMQHYVSMLRRYILSDSEIHRLCREIYQKHQPALDLIFEHRPDQQAELHEILLSLVEQSAKLTHDSSSKSYVRFIANEIDAPILKQGNGWTDTGRMLLFEFKNLGDRLGLYLIIGPGPNEIREKLYEIAKGGNPPLKYFQVMGRKFNTIYKLDFLTSSEYDKYDFEGLQERIEAKWISFLEKDLPRIVGILKKQTWMWESIDSEG